MLSRNESPQVSARFFYHTNTKGVSRSCRQTLFRTQCERFVPKSYIQNFVLISPSGPCVSAAFCSACDTIALPRYIRSVLAQNETINHLQMFLTSARFDLCSPRTHKKYEASSQRGASFSHSKPLFCIKTDKNFRFDNQISSSALGNVAALARQ